MKKVKTILMGIMMIFVMGISGLVYGQDIETKYTSSVYVNHIMTLDSGMAGDSKTLLRDAYFGVTILDRDYNVYGSLTLNINPEGVNNTNILYEGYVGAYQSVGSALISEKMGKFENPWYKVTTKNYFLRNQLVTTYSDFIFSQVPEGIDGSINYNHFCLEADVFNDVMGTNIKNIQIAGSYNYKDLSVAGMYNQSTKSYVKTFGGLAEYIHYFKHLGTLDIYAEGDKQVQIDTTVTVADIEMQLNPVFCSEFGFYFNYNKLFESNYNIIMGALTYKAGKYFDFGAGVKVYNFDRMYKQAFLAGSYKF